MKITDASVDRKGRLTLTLKLVDGMFQTFRCDDIKIDARLTVDVVESEGRMFKGAQTHSGTIAFTSKKVTVSTKRPVKKSSSSK